MSNMRMVVMVGSIFVAFGAGAARGLTWEVPGDGSNTCTIAVPSCDTVAAAVAAAAAADTIDIAAGTFNVASVAVDKNLTIEGAGTASTFLNVTAAIGLRIRANDITLRNLTIQNAPGDGIRLDAATVDGLSVESVNFTGNTSDAIQIGDAAGTYTNTSVDNCVFTNNTGSGIRTVSTSNVVGLTVTNSTFSGGGLGIYQANDGGSSKLSGLTVDACLFQNTTGTAAIYAEELRDAVIEDSTFTGNARGILIFKFYATSGVGVSNVKIQRNQFTNSTSASVQVQIHNTALESGLEIDDNDFSQNVGLRSANLGLIHVNLADTLSHAQVSVTDNRATLSGTFGAAVAAYGIMLRGNGPVLVSGNVLDGGDVGGAGNATNPASAGIYLRSSDSSADFNSIPSGATFDVGCNRIFGFQHGVVVFDPIGGALGGLGSGVIVDVNDNALLDNALSGVANGASPTIDAENNYWGCAAGPGNPGCDAIIGAVDADPVVAFAPPCVVCLVDADCDDGSICTGTETCNVGTGVCQSGISLNCDDSDACTNDSCDAIDGCVNDAITCDDTNACTNDSCDSGLGCQFDPITCDDGSMCTQDSCDSGVGCVFEAAPAVGCQQAAKMKLQLVRNTANDSKDKVSFTWNKGNAAFDDFGDPDVDAEYALCIYDGDGGVVALDVPAASTCEGVSCWKKSGKAPNYKGWAYKDKTKPATNDGISSIRTKASVEGKAGVSVKAKGTTIPPFDMTGGLTAPVTAQVVVSSEPFCWEGVFEAADIKKNDGVKFNAAAKNP